MGRGVAALRPDGDIRAGGSSLPTDFTYTGQRSEASLGLLDYRARMYDPLLARFLSADTIVPSPSSLQSLNRYSYVLNSPLVYVDPSGHRLECGAYPGECNGDIFYAGVSVLNDDPEVQAFLSEKMDGKHFLDPIKEWLKYGFIGSLVGDLLLPFFGFSPPQVRTGRGEFPFDAHDAIGDPGLGPEPGFHSSPNEIPTDLHAFGGKTTGPRPPRAGVDVFLDDSGMLPPSTTRFPDGASTFADPDQAPLTGHYYKLPKGTVLPKGLNVVADGIDVHPESPHPPTHHTIYNTEAMPYGQFIEWFKSLPWIYGGKK